MRLLSKIKKFLAFLLILILYVLTFILAVAAVLSVIFLISLGLLSLAVSLGMISGILTNVATDLAPPAMLLTGVFCVFSALAVCAVLYITAPKTVEFLRGKREWLLIDNYDN